MKPFVAQLRLEVVLTLRRGESLLLTLGIPVLLLVFFSSVDILPMGSVKDPVDFLTPGVLALAIMSTSMVSVAIATGFERNYLVLKRLGSTPLGRGRLLAAKTGAVVVVELIQFAVLGVIGLALGWSPTVSVLGVVGGVVLGTVAFCGLGFLIAGTFDALVTLALANGLYLLLLLISGMIVPLSELPGPMQSVAEALPSGALSEVIVGSLSPGGVAGRAWLVLVLWAVLAPLVATRLFRWE